MRNYSAAVRDEDDAVDYLALELGGSTDVETDIRCQAKAGLALAKIVVWQIHVLDISYRNGTPFSPMAVDQLCDALDLWRREHGCPNCGRALVPHCRVGDKSFRCVGCARPFPDTGLTP